MDNLRDNIIDDTFRSGLENARKTPPADMWNRIEAGLSEEPKRRGLIWWWTGVASVAVLVAAGFFLLFPTVEQVEMAHVTDSIEAEPIAGKEITENTVHKKTATSTQLEKELVDTGNEVLANKIPSKEVKRFKKGSSGIAFEQTKKTTTPAKNNASTRTERNHISGGNITPGNTDSDNNTIAITQFSDSSAQHIGIAQSDENPLENVSDTSNNTILPNLKDVMSNPLPVDPLNSGIAYNGNEPPNPDDREEEDKWLLGGYYGPSYSNAGFTQAPPQESTMFNSSNATADRVSTSSTSELKNAYSMGMQVGYQLTRRLNLHSGFSYADLQGQLIASSFTETIVLVDNLDNPDNDPSLPLSVPEVATVEEQEISDFNYNFVEFPVMLKYRLIDRQFGYFIGSGVSTVMFSQYSVTPEGSDTPTTSSAAFSQVNLLLSSGVEYRMFQRASISLEPTFRYGFFSSDSAPTNGAFNLFGVNAGLNFHF